MNNRQKNKTRIIYVILILGIIFGFFKVLDADFARNWELTALAITLLYTMVLYCFGFFQKEFEGMEIEDFGVLFVAFLFLLLITIFSFLTTKSIVNLSLECSRIISLIGLTLSSGLFWYMDNKIHEKCDKKDIKLTFKLSKIYSDKPITIIFILLTIYYGFIQLFHPEITSQSIEPFYSGAIAFQMMISNLIWTINDDSIIEERKLETCKK